MHELSIAMQIVQSVTEAVEDQPAARVLAVNLRVGAMSGVIPDALRFAWDQAISGTRVEGASLNIEEVTAAVWCPACEDEVEVPGFRMKCPVCGSPTPRLVRGKELDLLSLEVSDDEHEQATDP